MADKDTPIQSDRKAKKRSLGSESTKDISSPKVPNLTVKIGSTKNSNISTGDNSHSVINIGSQKEVQDEGSSVAREKSNHPIEEGPKDISRPKNADRKIELNVEVAEKSNIATGDNSYSVINVGSQKEVQDARSPVDRADSNSPKEAKLHRTVLNRCLTALVRNLDYDLVSMYIRQKEVFDDIILQDISDKENTSKRISELIKKIQQRDEVTYRKFKECLVQAHQKFLKDMLEEQEGIVQRGTVNKEKSCTKREEIKNDNSADKKKGHIMISYCWAQKKKAVWIKEQLETYGFPIWIDEVNMERELLSSMALAVEGAYVVLLCISEDYKSSRNCKREATYAGEKKKVIIPLKMEDVQLDGWLGILVTDNIYYNFSGNPPSNEEMKKLLRELTTYYNMDLKEPELVPSDSTIVSQEESGPDQDLDDNQSTGSE